LEMLKLLIADMGEEFRQSLADQVRGTYRIRVCQEGHQTLEMVLSFKPDLLVLDMMLPGLDGVSILEAIHRSGLHPTVLAVTKAPTDYMIQAASRYGVGYMMVKPCNVKATGSRLRDLTEFIGSEAVSRPEPRTAVTNILLQLGIPTKLRGYAYLREAILLAMRQPEQMVTKEIYPEVAKICRATRDQVERSIRSSIAGAYERRDEHAWEHFFPRDSQGKIQRPSNGTFIRAVAVRLANEHEFCENA